MMRRRFGVAVVAAASACALVAGCGSSSSGGTTSKNESTATPKAELVDSFRSLTAGSALTTTLSLDTTGANLMKLSRESGGSGLTPAQADVLASAKLVVESVAPDGKSLAEAANAGANSPADFSIAGSAGGTTYFTLLDVNKTLYFQLDLKDLIATAESHDGESTTYQRIVAQASRLPAFAQAVVAGKFVAVSVSTVSSLEAILKGALASSSTQIPSGTQVRALIGRLSNAVLSDVTVTRTTTGDTDQLVATGNIRTIARTFLTTLAKGVPALASQINPTDADQAPNRDAKLDASVTSGAISKVVLDVGQFSSHPQDSLPVVATFTKTGSEISAPSGATTISLQDLIAFFTTIDSESSTSSGSGSSVMPVPSPAQTSSAPGP